jgi:hypothetical protein
MEKTVQPRGQANLPIPTKQRTLESAKIAVDGTYPKNERPDLKRTGRRSGRHTVDKLETPIVIIINKN